MASTTCAGEAPPSQARTTGTPRPTRDPATRSSPPAPTRTGPASSRITGTIASPAGGQRFCTIPRPQAYLDTGPDDARWETDLAGLGRAFPHRITGGLTKPGLEFYTAFIATPQATDYELECARAAIEGENLGADDSPDLLAISITANDYAGHTFGPYSHEVQDITVRTDRQLGEFFR